uniref:U4/U6 small nuclear ribonucleoprotein Prp31 n=1 Tax=Dicentrarchus labrax TaxID=13489 RepID=A0A8C4GG97_DICLA
MSLADELLADLEEAGDEGEDGLYPEGEEGEKGGLEDIPEEMEVDYSKAESVASIAKLRNSKQFSEIMEKISDYVGKQRKNSEVCGPVESDPEYRLIVAANNLTVEIDNELNIIHKFTRDKYSKRFPELESLVPDSLDYIRTVKELGNNLEKCKTNETLQQILTNATIMVVSVTASTTQGSLLSEEELKQLEEACDMALELNQSKHRIYEYVESRMSFIAPNLSIIVGASTAAKIMGIAGGLTNLSKMPACNLMLLGAQRRTLSGFSSTSLLPHTGFIYHCDVVQTLPPDLRRKAARLVSAKCTLASRVDSFHESSDGKVGYDLKEEIERKFDKWQEPPPVKQVKPLPAPLDGQRKKRGGRRYRKMKERLGLTEIRKHANRMTFAEVSRYFLSCLLFICDKFKMRFKRLRRLSGGPGLQSGSAGEERQWACQAGSGQRGHQGQNLQIPSEDAAEAEHDVRRKINSQRPLLRNQLQCSVHSFTGAGDREPTGCREEGG